MGQCPGKGVNGTRGVPALQGLCRKQHSGSGVLENLTNPATLISDKQPRFTWSKHTHPHKSFSSDIRLSLVPTNCDLIELPFRMSFSSNLNHYGMVHVASVSDVLLDNSFTPPCQRMGGMVSFRTFEDFVRYVGKGDDCLCWQLPRWAQMEPDKVFALSRVRFKLVLSLFAQFLEFTWKFVWIPLSGSLRQQKVSGCCKSSLQPEGSASWISADWRSFAMCWFLLMLLFTRISMGGCVFYAFNLLGVGKKTPAEPIAVERAS